QFELASSRSDLQGLRERLTGSQRELEKSKTELTSLKEQMTTTVLAANQRLQDLQATEKDVARLSKLIDTAILQNEMLARLETRWRRKDSSSASALNDMKQGLRNEGNQSISRDFETPTLRLQENHAVLL